MVNSGIYQMKDLICINSSPKNDNFNSYVVGACEKYFTEINLKPYIKYNIGGEPGFLTKSSEIIINRKESKVFISNILHPTTSRFYYNQVRKPNVGIKYPRKNEVEKIFISFKESTALDVKGFDSAYNSFYSIANATNPNDLNLSKEETYHLELINHYRGASSTINAIILNICSIHSEVFKVTKKHGLTKIDTNVPQVVINYYNIGTKEKHNEWIKLLDSSDVDENYTIPIKVIE